MARQGAVGIEELIRRKVAESRRWRPTKLEKSSTRWGFQFTVMTYNILSQPAVENHRYLYKNCNPSFLQEDYRISKILPEILQSRCDIICLQEVEQHLYENRIKKIFDLSGFESIFKRKTGCKSDGCAILWRKAKFNLLKRTDVELRSGKAKFLDRDNVGLIVVLKPNHPTSQHLRLHVATTHLIFNPKRGDVKLSQLRLLLAELERLAFIEITGVGRTYHPTILCGDFNFEPQSPIYKFVQTGSISLCNAKSGDLSGQAEGKNKGMSISFSNLSLQQLGISNTGRFEEPDNTKVRRGRRSTPTGKASKPNQVSEHSKDAPSCSKVIETSKVDPMFRHCIGYPSDPRWISMLLASGNKDLAAELSARFHPNNSTRNSRSPLHRSNNSYDSDSNHSRSSTNQSSDYEEERFLHDFKFVSAYKYPYSKNNLITSITGNDFNNVDHIFYSVKEKHGPNAYSEGELRLLAVCSLMKADVVVDLGGLPNACLGSDHIYLMAKFAFK